MAKRSKNKTQNNRVSDCETNRIERRIKRNCKNCGIIFYARKQDTRKGYGKYCSRNCFFEFRKKTGWNENNGRKNLGLWSEKGGYNRLNKEIKERYSKLKSKELKRQYKEGKRKYPDYKLEKHPNWKGGKTKVQGYIYLKRPNHPYCDKRGYVKRSRLVIEEKLKRYLEPGEIIHHMNHIREDDREENLMLMLSHSEHKSEFHSKGKLNPNYKHGKYCK